jgi:hypothetical protein
MALPFVAGRCATALGQGLNMLSGMSMLGAALAKPGRRAGLLPPSRPSGG